MAVKIQFRRDTAANWTAANPTLSTGELALETDTRKFKIGNGTTAWTVLAYAGTMNVDDYVPVTRTINGTALDANVTLAHNDMSGLNTLDYQHLTAAELSVVQATSGINTGDQDLSGYAPLVQPFDVHVFIPGTLINAMTVVSVPVARSVSFSANLAGSYAIADTAATAESILLVNKNGTQVCSITFAAVSTTGVFSSASVSFAAGDILEITGPAIADTTLANIGIVLAGLR